MYIDSGGGTPNLDNAGSEENKKKTKIFLIVTAIIIISMIAV